MYWEGMDYVLGMYWEGMDYDLGGYGLWIGRLWIMT